MRRSVRSRAVSLGVLVGLVGAATLLAFAPGADAVEVVPVDWVQLPDESWDRDMGCSLAVRSGSHHGSPAFAFQTGSFGFFDDPTAPVVVDSILLNAGTSGATLVRDGGVHVAVGGGGVQASLPPESSASTSCNGETRRDFSRGAVPTPALSSTTWS